jgi:hypothetical protein
MNTIPTNNTNKTLTPTHIGLFPRSCKPQEHALAILDSTSPTPDDRPPALRASLAAEMCLVMVQSNNRMYTASASTALSTRVAQYLHRKGETAQCKAAHTQPNILRQHAATHTAAHTRASSRGTGTRAQGTNPTGRGAKRRPHAPHSRAGRSCRRVQPHNAHLPVVSTPMIMSRTRPAVAWFKGPSPPPHPNPLTALPLPLSPPSLPFLGLPPPASSPRGDCRHTQTRAHTRTHARAERTRFGTIAAFYQRLIPRQA